VVVTYLKKMKNVGRLVKDEVFYSYTKLSYEWWLKRVANFNNKY